MRASPHLLLSRIVGLRRTGDGIMILFSLSNCMSTVVRDNSQAKHNFPGQILVSSSAEKLIGCLTNQPALPPRSSTMSSSRNLRACMVCSIVKTHTVRAPYPQLCPMLTLPNPGIHPLRLPKLRVLSATAKLSRHGRGMHLGCLRLPHRRRRPCHLLGRQMAAPQHVPTWRVRGQSCRHAAGRGIKCAGGQ
jgi:hypothetical protein